MSLNFLAVLKLEHSVKVVALQKRIDHPVTSIKQQQRPLVSHKQEGKLLEVVARDEFK